MKSSQGFTFMEMMIVVAIIAILAAIAYPLYTQHIVKTNRVDVQSELMRLSTRLQEYRVINHTYRNATLANIGGTSNYPAQGTANYAITLALNTDNRGYTLTATPVAGRQNGDGVVCLNQDGQRFWSKGQNVCTLSATSTWND
ncbi:prepilin-type N-terminal cleavage/methylation domain-containing protein [Acinetobacter sp. ESL0695]|uniref:type IV pilin protein n=1 Tax=Acinetobacter sp. ESL0695 TaxID=2983215 RepID=UPI0023F0C7C9|nr:type IV pilin protein [Acinetobacter sp. ESL0695]WEV48687.1 prepilin-type N-terminal cleavage/methylation domain-containing protein [Acinetobacter sp. ESL0695]